MDAITQRTNYEQAVYDRDVELGDSIEQSYEFFMEQFKSVGFIKFLPLNGSEETLSLEEVIYEGFDEHVAKILASSYVVTGTHFETSVQRNLNRLIHAIIDEAASYAAEQEHGV